jgi:hypothetical protein
MSLSEPRGAGELADLVKRLADAADSATAGDVEALPEDALLRLVSTAVRLYATANAAASADIAPLEAEVSTTDAVVMACALLKARDLNPFDLALWFSRPRTAA